MHNLIETKIRNHYQRVFAPAAKLCLLISLTLVGCTETDEPDIETDESATGQAEQALANSHFYQYSVGGNIFSMPFGPYVTQQFDPLGDCTPGFVRPVRPSVWWTSGSGGWCGFYTWNTGDAHDCRALVVGSTGGGWFGGTCTTSMQEVPETLAPTGVFSFTGANTNHALANTTNLAIALNAGQTVTVSVCGEGGSSFSGDTYLRLYDFWGTQSADDDDACGRGSRIVYTATSGGSFQINAGCWSSGSCSGTVAWNIQ
jgi:hypothetical protein